MLKGPYIPGFNLFTAWEDAIWRPCMILHSFGTQRANHNIAMNSTSPQLLLQIDMKIPNFSGTEKVKDANFAYSIYVYNRQL